MAELPGERNWELYAPRYQLRRINTDGMIYEVSISPDVLLRFKPTAVGKLLVTALQQLMDVPQEAPSSPKRRESATERTHRLNREKRR